MATRWNRQSVREHGQQIAKAFNIRISGQCRGNNVSCPGCAEDSLHKYRNGCRAIDFVGNDADLLRAESWARGTDAFQEVIYSNETRYHRTGGRNNHLHLGWPVSGRAVSPSGGGDLIGFEPAGFFDFDPFAGLVSFLQDVGLTIALSLIGLLLIMLGGYLIAKDVGLL